MIRLICDIILVLSVFLLPPFITLFFILLSILFFNNFIEAFFVGAILDLIYGGGGIFNTHLFFFFTLVTFLFYILSIKLKKILRLSI